MKKMLIIDDDVNDVDIMERCFAAAGLEYDIVLATSGEEGIIRADEEKPDVIILDTIMPGMEGFEVCQAIRDVSGLSVKIIIVTGDIDAVDVCRAMKVGADDYSVKTHDYAELIDSIQKVCLSDDGVFKKDKSVELAERYFQGTIEMLQQTNHAQFISGLLTNHEIRNNRVADFGNIDEQEETQDIKNVNKDRKVIA